MKRGTKFFPLPNPEIGEQPFVPKIEKAQGEILGIPVEFVSHYPGVAEARGFFGKKRIVVGPMWLKLDQRIQRAVLLHEAKHCIDHHLEKRVALLALTALPLFLLPTTTILAIIAFGCFYYLAESVGKEQERIADSFAVEHGYGLEMAKFLKATHTAPPSPFYHSYEKRQDSIEKAIKEREQ